LGHHKLELFNTRGRKNNEMKKNTNIKQKIWRLTKGLSNHPHVPYLNEK